MRMKTPRAQGTAQRFAESYSVQNKRASRDCDALLLHWSGSPSNSRRPAVIRPATMPRRSQWTCLRVSLEKWVVERCERFERLRVWWEVLQICRGALQRRSAIAGQFVGDLGQR